MIGNTSVFKKLQLFIYTDPVTWWDLVDSNHSLKDEIYSLAAVSERLSVPKIKGLY